MKILLIDDDLLVLETVSLVLSSGGHTVLTASHPRDVFAQPGGGQIIDLVLTVLNMPQISDLELVRRVRRRWPRLHVGIITGSLDELPAGDLTLDVLVTKPVDQFELQHAVERIRAKA